MVVLWKEIVFCVRYGLRMKKQLSIVPDIQHSTNKWQH